MTTVRLKFAKTVSVPRPLTGDMVPFAGFRFELTAPSGASSSSEVTLASSWDFPGALPGTYKASLFIVDQRGQTIGEPLSITVTVPVDEGGGGGGMETYLQPQGFGFEFLPDSTT